MADISAPATLIRFDEVWKTYGIGHAAVHALAGVNMSIGKGEFVAIMGASGSGKSTAMNILGCLDLPTSGRFLFLGADVAHLSRNERARLRRQFIGFVFQGFNLMPRTSAVENVELPLIYRGMAVRERRGRAMSALRQVGLEGRERHSASELSGGQQQRVAMARAIVTEPVVLLADEPTGNLDTTTSREVMELLTRLNERQGITVIMVTHEEEMAAYARRVIRFVDGRVADDHPNAVVA